MNKDTQNQVIICLKDIDECEEGLSDCKEGTYCENRESTFFCRGIV